MKKIVLTVLVAMLTSVACTMQEIKGGGWVPEEKPGTGIPEDVDPIDTEDIAEQNLLRAMQLLDASVPYHFNESKGMLLSEYYNPFNGVRSGTGGSEASIWKYTAYIEAVNAIMHGLEAYKESGEEKLYNENFDRYKELLKKLYDNAAYYKGSFNLTSYTQNNKRWSVYAVPRADSKNSANVSGTLNVYDDQQWFIRELLEAYRLTGDDTYFKEAEYLTEYVLDGWDCTLDSNGNENGGIPWGPGYVTKHSCSNGPFISPLVWLHELYKGKNDEIEYRYIESPNKRVKRTMKKSEYYLMFAEKIYEWQKSRLLNSNGVFNDMMGGCDVGSGGLGCDVRYETVDNIRYRANSPLTRSEGRSHSYNVGSMISGAVDLYRATGEAKYLTDLKKMSNDSFKYFAKLGATKPGYYTYAIDGFANWFNGVMMRAWAEAAEYHDVDNYLSSFQRNLDYGYDMYLYKGFLPTNLLGGWSKETSTNKVSGMFMATFAAEYAVLAQRELKKDN